MEISDLFKSNSEAKVSLKTTNPALVWTNAKTWEEFKEEVRKSVKE